MEYTYATCILNESGEEINEANLTAVLEAAGCQVQESRVKAIVAALEDVEIDSVTSVDSAAVGTDARQDGRTTTSEASSAATDATDEMPSAASDATTASEGEVADKEASDGEPAGEMDVVPPVADGDDAESSVGAGAESAAGVDDPSAQSGTATDDEV